MTLHWTKISVLLGKSVGPFGFLFLVLIAYLGVTKRRRVHAEGKRAYKHAVAKDMHEPTTLHPEINTSLCAGCGACVRACPEGDILKMVEHRAVLASPTKCVGHGQCEVACPFGAIDLVFGTQTSGMELPRVTTSFETNVKGLYIAGELGGMGLIRNAVKQGRLAAEHALKRLPTADADVDLLIVGAGSAGLAAAMAATEKTASYLCIEQNSMGGTIANFPRQKIVMTKPAVLPIVGNMTFPQNRVSKEQLLGYWQGLRERFRLKIEEQRKFLSLEKKGDVFHVQTSGGQVVARKVILAMGVRGSPKKLGVRGEDLSKVTYQLLEPSQYVKKNILVVGGGNSACEAAVMLASTTYKNHVTLAVRGKSLDRANDANTAAVFHLASTQHLSLKLETTIDDIGSHQVTLRHENKTTKLANDYVFIFVGSDMPFAFLRSLGVAIDKKFGEKRQQA